MKIQSEATPGARPTGKVRATMPNDAAFGGFYGDGATEADALHNLGLLCRQHRARFDEERVLVEGRITLGLARRIMRETFGEGAGQKPVLVLVDGWFGPAGADLISDRDRTESARLHSPAAFRAQCKAWGKEEQA